MPLEAIGKKLGMHPSTVSYRIRKLRKMDVIRKFTISVDWRKLGKNVEAQSSSTASRRTWDALPRY